MLEKKAIQLGLEKKQRMVGSRDLPLWRLLTHRMNNLGWWGLDLRLWIACVVVDEMRDNNYPRASKVSLAPIHFYCQCCSRKLPETSVSNKIESNHFLYTTLKYVSVVRVNFTKSVATGANIVGTRLTPLLQFTSKILHKYSNLNIKELIP